MKMTLFFFAVLLALPAAGQAPDVPPVFAHPDSSVARTYPGPQALYRFLLSARANPLRKGCSHEEAYLKFRYNENMQLDTLMTIGQMDERLIGPFRQRIRESVTYLKSPRMLGGKPAKSKWYIMPFFSDFLFEQGCKGMADDTFLAYRMMAELFSGKDLYSNRLYAENEAYVLLYPLMLSGSP